MNAYQAKFEYLAKKQGWLCVIWKDKYSDKYPPERLTDLHHLTHNTKQNRARFPKLIDSLLNLVAVSNRWHLANPSWGRRSDLEAERVEKFLERHPKISKWVNDLGEI